MPPICCIPRHWLDRVLVIHSQHLSAEPRRLCARVYLCVRLSDVTGHGMAFRVTHTPTNWPWGSNRFLVNLFVCLIPASRVALADDADDDKRPKHSQLDRKGVSGCVYVFLKSVTFRTRTRTRRAAFCVVFAAEIMRNTLAVMFAGLLIVVVSVELLPLYVVHAYTFTVVVPCCAVVCHFRSLGSLGRRRRRRPVRSLPTKLTVRMHAHHRRNCSVYNSFGVLR